MNFAEIVTPAAGFDWTVNLGQVGIVASFVFTCGVWAATQRNGLKAVKDHLAEIVRDNGVALKDLRDTVNDRFLRTEAQIGKIESKIEDQTKIFVAMAKTEERLTSIDQRNAAFDTRLAAMNDDIGQVRQWQHMPRVVPSRGEKQI